MGGANAYFCPECRKKRQKESVSRVLRGRAEQRGKQLDEDCKKAKISIHEYGMSDKRKFCYGLMDMMTEEAFEKCVKCGAYVNNSKPPQNEELADE